MATEVKTKENSSSSNNNQNYKIQSKVSDGSEKKGRGKKRTFPTENKNDKMEFAENQTNKSTFVKSFVQNSVISSNNRALGLSSASAVSKFHKEVIVNQIKRFKFTKLLSPFDRRVTALLWHPKYPQVFIAGSKGGDLLLHNLNGSDDYFIPGTGPGGSILGLKCSDEDPYTIYTASLTGKICWENFQEKKSGVFLSLPLSWNNWFTSLDICKNKKCLLTGDSRGNAYLLSTSGEPIWQERLLHSSKVTHCEFNIHDPDVFVTASNDHTVKLWDLRTVSSSKAKPPQPLAIFSHVKAVNSAYFSPSNGLNILTTDQHSELRIYSGPLWDKIIKITHPHRQFQHMTQIKATWHPLEDIIIVGRYPDDNVQINDSRTIDFYDGSNGELLHKITSPTNNIVSLNAVNSTSENLVVAAAFSIVFLKDELVSEENRYATGPTESDEDTESTVLKSNKKKKNAAKVAKKDCPKQNLSSKKKHQ